MIWKSAMSRASLCCRTPVRMFAHSLGVGYSVRGESLDLVSKFGDLVMRSLHPAAVHVRMGGSLRIGVIIPGPEMCDFDDHQWLMMPQCAPQSEAFVKWDIAKDFRQYRVTSLDEPTSAKRGRSAGVLPPCSTQELAQFHTQVPNCRRQGRSDAPADFVPVNTSCMKSSEKLIAYRNISTEMI